MCGIAGAIREIPPPPEAAARPRDARVSAIVARMAAAQRHRGPDGGGAWESPGQEVVLGHRRLAVLDLSEAGAQPMVDRATGCAVAFNGEVYNFSELRTELVSLGETFRSSCDTEVILKAWSRWGTDAVRRLRGIFAFALWDPRARAVHLARDPMGVKPLYWTTLRLAETGEDVVLFASEVRALLAAGVPRRLDPAGVASYLWQGFVVGPGTIVDGVHLLPAGTVLSLVGSARGNVRASSTYWTPRADCGRVASSEELRHELARAVELQLAADVPLGVFLSGGVDSSAVAALASRARPGSVHTFTVGFDVPGYDESAHAERVAAALGTRHSASVLTAETFRGQLEDAFAAIDQPTFDGLNTYFVSRAAREAGMTVALAGTGGDEVFGGYPSFARIPALLAAGRRVGLGPRRGAFARALAAGVAAGARAAHRVAWDGFGVAPPQSRWGKAADLARAAGDPLALYQVSYALFTRDTQAALAAGTVRAAQRAQDHGLPPDVAASWRRRIESCDPRQAVSLLELASFAGERLLRDTDTASMAVGLEVRVPLLDHVLGEAAAALDPDRRFSRGGRKHALRDAALGGLDPALFDRPKSGFVLPIDAWARERLQPEMDGVFADDALAGRAGLRGGAVRTLWSSFRRGRPGLYWSRAWSLFVLMKWCRSHDAAIRA